MRVFVTGATGFIGSRIVQELLNHGHQVLGLARSEDGAKALAATGADVLRGELQDLDILRSGASQSDGVIHTAFNHDFSKFAANCEEDRRAIEALGATLEGSDRPLLVTGGLALLVSGRAATEADPAAPVSENYPRASEAAALALADRGVYASIVRLPQVHDRLKFGLISYFIDLARQTGVSAYVGEGLNHYSAVHVLDAARLYRLALEKRERGAVYHAVAEEGVSIRQIAEVIERGLNVPVVSKSPEEAAEHFGWLGRFIGLDLYASSAQTQQHLGWHPTGPGLIDDLEHAEVFQA